MIEMTALDLLKIAVPTAITTAGVAGRAVMWAVKRELNGSARRIKDIDDRTIRLESNQHFLGDRLTKLETIVEERTG